MKEGILNILKPPGMTSSDAVADIRKIFSLKRVGHTGTLDPGAAGVLGICLGRATRLFDLLVNKQKEYICEICFGASTDTQDSYGAVCAESNAKIDAAMLETALPFFRGTIMQTAPLYSALKVDGKAMYAHAREGHQIEAKVRQADIETLELLEQSGDNRFLLKINCGRGTYIRTICNDIGERLGVPAHMSFLLRTKTGELHVEDAYTIPELLSMREQGTLEDAVLAPDALLGFLPSFCEELSGKNKRLFFNGTEIEADVADGKYRVYADGSFCGIGEAAQGHIHLGISFLEV